MTKPVRTAIRKLGRQLASYEWGLYDGRIRQPEINGIDGNCLTLCPIATAVTCVSMERLTSFLSKGRNAHLRDLISKQVDRIAKRMDDPAKEIKLTEAEKLRTAAGSIIQNAPKRIETEELLRIERSTLWTIVDAADKPAGSAEGRLLIESLSSAHNRLREEFAKCFRNAQA